MDAEPVLESTTKVNSQVQDCFALLPGEAEENGELLFWSPQRSAESDAPYEVHEIYNLQEGENRASQKTIFLWFRDQTEDVTDADTVMSLDLNNLNLTHVRGDANLLKPFQGFLYSHPEYCSMLRAKLAAVKSAERSALLYSQLNSL